MALIKTNRRELMDANKITLMDTNDSELAPINSIAVR